MPDPDRIFELESRNAALRAVVDRYVPRAGPATSQALDQIAAELEFTGDSVEDLERTYANLKRRADLVVEHQVAEPASFDDPPRLV